MAPDHIDLTGITSDDSDASQPMHRTPRTSLHQSRQPSQPGSRTRRPVSPPAFSGPVSPSAAGENVSMASASAPALKGNPRFEQHRGGALKSATLSAKTNAVADVADSQGATPPALSSSNPAHRTPKHQTPKKADWTTDRIEEALIKFSHDIGTEGARHTTRLLHLSWKKMAPNPNNYSKKNWFADMKRTPAEAGQGSLKLKLKASISPRLRHMGPGRTGKQEKREHYEVIGIKTDREPVPKYDFHHVEISKNILSPNTMLNFVPHLRDLADHEEPKYRRWLENLESMDKTSGFATLSRQEKVHKTFQKERATTLLLYLDLWLDKLSIENCSKATLIHHMASQTDAMTPQQSSSILNSYSHNGSPRSAKTTKMFTEAFDRVFDDDRTWKEGAVTLRDVLLLDKSVDSVVDSRKWLKDTPSQLKPVEENSTVETFLETYALLGCLVCFSHSCEHGEYGIDNERKRFSVEVVGGLAPLVRKKATQAAKELGDGHPKRKPCSEDCYLNRRPGTRARGWSETEIMLLKTAVTFYCDLNEPIQCATAIFTGRPCWDVNRQFEKMGLQLPNRLPPAPVEVKSVHWYDRNKRMLLADWQEQTITHEHHKKDHFDPCNHDGPCTKDNCDCVKYGLMCERFCRCTAETCAVKFTGCACHSQGKTCLPRQKGEKPCICVQLNRECDPALCGTCGATDRANPRNADDDQLFTSGCQNCSLQRGKSKSLVLGESTIEGCGYGLFAAEDIAQDDFVIEYVGELIYQDEGVRREARRGDVFDEESNSSYLFTLLEQEGIWVDAAIYGNLSRYINHQDDFGKGQGCNITPKILYVCGEYRIKFSAIRDIDAGEELFFNYGENFPNLTKKLLDEQKAEEKVKKQRDQKGMNEEEGNSKKPKGRKRGRKPKKKSFAAIVESDVEDEDTTEAGNSEDPFPEPSVHRSRKRKRNIVGDDSDEEDYQPVDYEPNIESGASRSRFRGRPRTSLEGSAQGTELGGNNLFGRAIRNRSEARPDGVDADADMDMDMDMVDAETPRSRVKRKRRVIEDEDDIEIDDNLDAEYNDGKPANGTKRGSGATASRRTAADDSAAEEETPSRLRARRWNAQEAQQPDPLSGPTPAIDSMDVEQRPGVGSNAQPPVPQAKKKRGRPRKIQIEEIADTDDPADENSISGSAGVGYKPSQSTANESDASSNGMRGRVRKRPARYDE
ncbi:hypothetical protein AB5N19_08388 [Seiridium cardinale]